MNYTLTSTRRIGKYFQKIIVSQFGAPKADSVAQEIAMEEWHKAVNALNAGKAVDIGEEYKGFTENEGSGNTNNGVYADGWFTVLSEIGSNTPKTVTYNIKDLSLDDIVDLINDNCQRLIGTPVTNAKNYLISALLDLHRGGEDGDVSV